MSYLLRFTSNALQDIQLHKKSGNKVVLRKIEVLLNELREHPKTGTGKPELLKDDLKGYYSRRINNKHRLIYDINDEIVTVIILNAYAHYGDE